MAYKKLLLCFFAFVIFNSRAAVAQDEAEKPWRVDTSLGIFSDYMFRGFNLFPGTSIQPSITGTYEGDWGALSANLWMHISGEDGKTDGPESFTELDETLRYTYTTEEYAVSTGIAWYTYPDSSDNIDSTEEVFASIVFNNLLNPTFSFYQDIDEFDSQYYEFSISHIFENVAGDASLTPFAGMGFASNSEKVYADDGLVQTTVGITLAIPFCDIVISPGINYTFESDDAIENKFWFGTTLTYSF